MSQLSPTPGNLSDDEITQALSTYTATQPRPGLESRVLRSVAAGADASLTHRHPVMRLSGWVAVSSAVAAALVFLLLAHFRSPATPSQSAHNNPPTSHNSLPRNPHLTERETSTRPRSPRASPAQRHIPIARESALAANPVSSKAEPHELNQQERLLEQIASRGSALALTLHPPGPIALVPLEHQPIEIQPLATQPIVIAPIGIAALQPVPNPIP